MADEFDEVDELVNEVYKNDEVDVVAEVDEIVEVGMVDEFDDEVYIVD